MLKPITVTLLPHETAPTFSGFTTGRKWNGFECPLFEKPAMERVLGYLASVGAILRYRFDEIANLFRVWERDGFDTCITCTVFDGSRCLFNPLDGWAFVRASPWAEQGKVNVEALARVVGVLPVTDYATGERFGRVLDVLTRHYPDRPIENMDTAKEILEALAKGE